MTNPIAAHSSIVLDPIVPAGLVALLGLAMGVLTVLVYRGASARLVGVQGALLLALRLAGIALLLLVLLQPSRVEQIAPTSTSRVTLIGIDDSKSMAQRDVAQGTRSEAARSILADAEILAPDGSAKDAATRLFKFADDAAPILNTSALAVDGATTRVHHSVATMLGSLRGNESARAILLLTDGHDFELVNPAKTGFLARSRQTPIFAVPLGKQGKVRDVAVRITSYQPYTYVKQKARLGAALRLVGCELETLNVELVRDEKVVQTRKIAAGEEREIAVSFDVVEPTIGQFEYEIRVTPLDGEADVENNRALTYLNVIDQQIQVLFLEGSPYWDTTFLQRSLMRNDKMNVDSIVEYAKDRARLVRKKEGELELKIPANPDEWRRYDVVVLGRAIENLLSLDGLHQLESYVKEHGGTVIFARGPAFGGALAKNELEPVVWSQTPLEHVRLQTGTEGQSLAPFRTIQEQAGADAVPELIAGYSSTSRKPLTATLASALPVDGGGAIPGMVHRRLGDGQVLSVGVDGLWRWAFNAKVESANTVFDRFWDQMILWLMAGRDFLPAQRFSLRANSANIPLGEKIFFRGIQRDAAKFVGDVPMVIEQGGSEVGRVALTAADAAAPDKLVAEFLPGRVGKYTATARFPDGAKQSVRFIVFDENLEQTEVATDAGYLKKLCESSGGRVLQPDEVGKVFAELAAEKIEASPTTRLVSLWDRIWFFWLTGLLFAADWFLRRRWGLS